MDYLSRSIDYWRKDNPFHSKEHIPDMLYEETKGLGIKKGPLYLVLGMWYEVTRGPG